MKRESTNGEKETRNEKHKDKKEEDQHGNLNREIFCCQGIPQMRLTKRKRNLFSKKVEKRKCVPTFRPFGCAKKKTKETRYFVERDRNRRKMAKTKGEGSKDKCDQ